MTLGSMPLLLLFFHQFSLVSPLANALAIPFVSFIITPLALSFAVLPWMPLLHLDHWLLSHLMVWLEWLADWPMWRQAALPLWVTLVAVAGIVWLLLPRGFPARWLGLCLLMPALFWPPHVRVLAKPGSMCSMSGRGWPSLCGRPGTRCSTIPVRFTVPIRTPGNASYCRICARAELVSLTH